MGEQRQGVKIAFFEIPAGEEEQVRKSPLGRLPVAYFREELDSGSLASIQGCEILSVFIYSRVGRETLKALPNLRLIATRSTGCDHIDLAACKEQGVAVANVPSYGENTVAEHTFGLILALSRNIHKAYVRTVHGDFSLPGLEGFDLAGKTLGVVGAGHIGLHVIKIAKGFGMRVLAFDPKQYPLLAEILGFEYVPLEELLQRSDVISLHAPYTQATHHLIHKGNIRLIKRGALLINTSRGGLVETDALVLALDEGILAGAGLDVLEGEELIKEERQLLSRQFPQEKLETLIRNHILLHRDNVVITPHIAFYSREALQRILDTTIQNITAFLQDQPQHLVA